MANQKVCDGCGATAAREEAQGNWARLYVPPVSWLAPSAGLDQTEHPELDLCVECFRSVLSIVTAFGHQGSL